MARGFVGKALPLDSDAMHEALEEAEVGAPEIWAVLDVETSGCGFLASRRPKILFERHVFSRETGGRYDASNPEVSNRNPGGYGASGEHQYDRLAQALELDRAAALRSASWGIGQVMGFNATSVGFSDVEDMVGKMMQSEGAQLMAMVRFLETNGLARALRRHDWPAFARGYNGPGYAANSYETRLAASFEKFLRGPPDLTVRAAQVLLSYLGYEPGKVDGMMGKYTRSAMNAFQEDRGLPVTRDLDDVTFARLSEAASSGESSPAS
jgi:hypothetical protein